MKDKSQFTTWITCDDLQLGLATAVHESVHNLTDERDAYPLIGGGNIPRRHAVEHFFAPKLIAGQMARNFNDTLFIQTYLRPGAASSADDFMYLLDELNAFSHDLNAATRLTALRNRDSQVDHRDGLAAMMAFVMGYATEARKDHPKTWTGLKAPQTAKVVQTLWKQAEKVMAASCGIPDFGTNDREYISYVCNAKNAAALSKILRRAPSCPKRCLTGTATTAAQ
ncbi:hypothetical protein C5748_05545 [Phyllobacterium phragmitis]|uniref:Uncharacterized protein n=2 Tax=Phyllobacterium phragmitis TaxID=2670329 RepID=A0A2S9IWE0_9HYPH|nr:hypothetical protein C5748_05545 [Phyllobacterium phragmitis]